MATLERETESAELRRRFDIAATLHINFYENWLDEDQIRRRARDVREFFGTDRDALRTCGLSFPLRNFLRRPAMIRVVLIPLSICRLVPATKSALPGQAK